MKYGEFLEMADKFTGKKNLTDRIPWFVSLAKINIQRRHDFAFTWRQWQTQMALDVGVGVNLPSDFKRMYGDHAVRLRLSSGYIPLESTTYERVKRREIATTYVTFDGDNVAVDSTSQNSNDVAPVRYYVFPRSNGQFNLHLVPEQVGAYVLFEYYGWLPEYRDTEEEDFLLQRGHDVLLWETLKVANTYLFDEERIPINNAAFEQAFSDFVALDSRNQSSHAPIDVD